MSIWLVLILIFPVLFALYGYIGFAWENRNFITETLSPTKCEHCGTSFGVTTRRQNTAYVDDAWEEEMEKAYGRIELDVREPL